MKKVLIIASYFCAAVLQIYAQNDIVLKIDDMVNQYYNMNLFSGTIMVAEKGKPIYQKAIGYADIENKISNEINTAFNFGSIGKLFTSVAILKLVEEGKLQLDDTIEKYINYFPKEISGKITIRHLLRHESGLGDYLSNPKFRQNIGNYKSLNDLMNLIKEEQLLFEPGTSNSYSNSGYATLGSVIEAVTKESFYAAAEHIVLQPLGLAHTYYSNVDQVRENVVKYVRNLDGEIIRTLFQDWPSPAGGEYSTVGDLMSFIQGILYENKILTDESKAIFLNQFEKNNQTTFQEIIRDERRVPIWAGGAPGVNGIIIQFLTKNVTITVLSNYGTPMAINIGMAIRSIIDRGDFEPPKIPIGEKIYAVFKAKGPEYIEKNFNDLIADYPIIGPKDAVINQIGYDLIGMQRLDEAIQLFKVNTKLFPDIANTFDSLAEAYMISGNNAKAIENYKKILEIDPNNTRVIENMKKLQEEK